MTSYTIEWTDGRRESAASHDEAAAAIRARIPGAVVGHPGDLTDDGDRTLAWPDEASAEGDDGAKAIAVIRAAR